MIDHPGWPVTGTGAVAALGHSPAEIFAGLCAGTSGLHPMRGFDRSCYTGDRLFEIDDRGDGGDVPGRATAFLLDAVAQALTEAGLDEQLGEIPVLVGTGLRELRSVELWARDDVPLSADRLHFGTALRERFGATMTHTFSNACSASLYALAMGTDLLAAGATETVVVAGVDTVTESMVGIADRLQSVAPDTVRPFDRNRLGTILGEGASAVVLRRTVEPGQPCLGWVRAVAVNCDAHHATAPEAGSIAVAIRDAQRRAGVGAADIDLVMLHGTGTHANDVAEAEALRAVFGAAPEKTLMTAIKSMTGHTSGASGLHSLIAALQSMSGGLVPPTIGLDEPIDDVTEFRIVRGAAAPANLALAQVNAFGFGGINAVAIVAGLMSAAVTGVGLAVPGAFGPADLTSSTAAGAAPVDAASRIGKKGLRYHDQATRLALCAARDALNAAGLMLGDARMSGSGTVASELLVPANSVAVVVSSNFGNLDSVCEVVTGIAADGSTRLVRPVLTPRLSSNVIASEVAIRFGLRGPNLMVCNGATSGLDAVHWAMTLLASGRVQHVLVVGVEPAEDVVRRLTGHDHPFDGAAALVLETPAAAAERSVAVLAGLDGYVRTGGLHRCLAALAGTALADTVTAWFAPQDAPAGILPGVPRHDLADRWGPASGALGVLQCTAAVGHFAAGGDGPVYALSGTDADDAVAGLVITAPAEYAVASR